ncbi:hypothetical protein JM658_01680 [Joostella atrarenae]|uniref:Uncharacterized protein n=1 Tax=Joostella atrarenae TaxID=679257 RepID=A0ABS9IZC5_9FLAO|nr:hypothetical protein [Joostella atrarenae]MCF8713523.1 hypothetical protein [Joostella atrarenae]
MKKKLEAELISISERIIRQNGKRDLAALQSDAQKLYEKLTLLKYVEDHFGELQSSDVKSEVADRFEVLANSVLKGNSDVPESNPNEHEDAIMTPVIDSIRDLVQEMPEAESLEELLSGITPDPTFVKRDMDLVTPKIKETTVVEKKVRSRNHQLKSGLAIGLNDKLAFVKHLFNNSNEDYIRVVSQISTMDTFEDARGFITTMIKPDYNNWEGKEAYENRFLEIIENKFS